MKDSNDPYRSAITRRPRQGSIQWQVPSGQARRLLEPLLPFPEGLEGLQEIKRSSSRLVVTTSLQDGRKVYLKRYLLKTAGRKAASLFHTSKVKREYNASRAALERGIPVARVIGAAEIRQNGILVESYIAHEAVEPAVSLRELLQNPQSELGPITRKELLGALARFLVSIQTKGFKHDDLESDHILVRLPLRNPPQFVLIDLDAARLYSHPLDLAAIVHNLVQLNRSLWGERPTPAERLQFLRDFIKVHPRLKDQRVRGLWRRIAVLSALRRETRSYAKRVFYRSQFEFGGHIPRRLRRILKGSE